MNPQAAKTPRAGEIPQFTLSDRIRKARESAGLDQGGFAEEIGISRSSVSNYETGTSRPMRVVLKAIALRTGVPLTWLETGETSNPRPGDPDGGCECAILDSNQEPIDLESADSGDSSVIDFAARRRAAETAPGTSDDDEQKAA